MSARRRPLTVTVSDPDNDPLAVTFHGRRASGTAQDFTIVALPDTQHYVDSANFPIFTAQTQWIVNNRNPLNIVFATQLGDITEHGDAIELEWQRADASMDVLDNNGIPNSVVPGNHDLGTAGVGNFFDQYFPPSRYLGTPWYAGYLGSDPQDAVNRLNKNNYNLFSVDGLDFILINLEYNMPAFAVTWANRILQEHPNRRAIISTHMFIKSSGGRPTSPYNRPDGTSAEAVFQQLVFPNCNVFLVLNGHYHGESAATIPIAAGSRCISSTRITRTIRMVATAGCATTSSSRARTRSTCIPSRRRATTAWASSTPTPKASSSSTTTCRGRRST